MRYTQNKSLEFNLKLVIFVVRDYRDYINHMKNMGPCLYMFQNIMQGYITLRQMFQVGQMAKQCQVAACKNQISLPVVLVDLISVR